MKPSEAGEVIAGEWGGCANGTEPLRYLLQAKLCDETFSQFQIQLIKSFKRKKTCQPKIWHF